MGFKIFTFRVLIAIVFISASSLVNSVQGQSRLLFDRLSLTVNGGINFGDPGQSLRIPIMRSNLTRRTEHTNTFGSSLQYALSPAWSLEAGYKYSNIRGELDSFETTINTVSFKNIINLDQVFALSKILPIINPYLSLGVGYDYYFYDSTSESSFYDNSLSYNLGAGLALKVYKSIDVFGHYEYHLTSNTVDNRDTGFRADLLNTLTGGLRINFSSRGKKSSISSSDRFVSQPAPVEDSPYPVVDETSPSDEVSPADEVSSSEDSDFVSVTKKIEHLEEDVNRLEQRIDEQEQRYMENPGNTQATGRLVQRVENMEVLLQEVRSKLGDIPDKPVVENSSGIAESIPRGTYVQIFASGKLSAAQKVRSDAISHLGNRLNDTSEQVFITRRDKFYQVLIGEFSDKEKAENIKKVMSDRHSDAFLIIFPRPMSLQSAYNDMQIVE